MTKLYISGIFEELQTSNVEANRHLLPGSFCFFNQLTDT